MGIPWEQVMPPNPEEDTLTPLQISALQVGLKKLFRGDRFDICTVRDLCEMLQLSAHSRAVDQLRPFHCVAYGDMPEGTREMLMQQVAEVLNINPKREQTLLPRYVDVNMEPVHVKAKGLLGRLFK